ncbi:hypothetical protein VP01_3404g1 [Puccinia sorghi]|uniref:Uncharacterized protein n=1 Tax=Puccinia sorghi TaxID=27349 RepID=A0A0L6UWK2_9BASI|nr:hypothetical protein VP01_3404g1 [Puccinia sorghi]
MPSASFALNLLLLLPGTYAHSIDPIVVPRNLLHRRGIDQSTLLENGKAAQKLNAQFSTMDPNSSCKTGDMACISGGFSQCVAGKFVGGPCAQGLKCFALPLLLKKGTTLGCDTEADATSRISNTGATGGLAGNGDTGSTPSLTSNSTKTPPTPDSKGLNQIQSNTTDSDVDLDEHDESDEEPEKAPANNSKVAAGQKSSSRPTNSSSSSPLSNETGSEEADDPDESNDATNNPTNSSSHHTVGSNTAPLKVTSPKDKLKKMAEVVDLDEMNANGA